MQLSDLEILSPAKNREIGIAAIDCGADSLYIAGPAFGAREAAGNSLQDIELLAKYAHRFGSKVYMVINTILYDNEMEQAVALAKGAYEAGCDALIIQDLGLLKANLPPLPLFASTQTNIRTPEQALLLESLGFKRLILARELSIEQIKEIKTQTTVELESFVHGALCVSYSGQCYMSSRVTGRSGNRGECAQLCRNNYNLIDANGKIVVKNRPLLSLSDLNLANYIPQLALAGVTSFKIEGRLKDVAYVKNIVRYYRSIVDSFIDSQASSSGQFTKPCPESHVKFKKASYGSLHGGFVPRPQNTFNRGYTTLFVNGERGAWNSGALAKQSGEYIGKIESVSKDKSGNLEFTHTSSLPLSNGDGLCIVTPSGEVTGLRVSVSSGNRVITNQKNELYQTTKHNRIVDYNGKVLVVKGSRLYRNFNKVFEKELEINMPERLLDVAVKFISSKDKLTLTATCEDGREVFVSRENSFELARDGSAKEKTIAQLEKKAGIYKFVIKEYQVEQQLFYPASFLNECRRELASLLEQKEPIIKNSADSTSALNKSIKTAPNELIKGQIIDYRGNVANSFARELYLELGAKSVDDAFEITAPKEVELMRCKYCIKYELGMCPFNEEHRKATAQTMPEPLFLENNGRKFKLGFDCKRCEMIIFG